MKRFESLILLLCICLLVGCGKNESTETQKTVTESETIKEIPTVAAMPTATAMPTEVPSPTPTPYALSMAYETYVRDDVYRIPIKELSENWCIIETNFAGEYALLWITPPWKENEEERTERDEFILISPGLSNEQYRTTPDYPVGIFSVLPEGDVILVDSDSGMIHVYDKTLSEIRNFVPGDKEAIKTIGVSDRGLVWAVDGKNSELVAFDLEGNTTGRYSYDDDLIVDEYKGLTDESECFHAISNDESGNVSFIFLSVSDDSITRRNEKDPELGEGWDNSWITPDSAWEVAFAESTWFIHEPGNGRKGFVFPKNKVQEGVIFLQDKMLCSGASEWNENNTYMSEYCLMDLEKKTVSDILPEKEFPDYIYMSAKGEVGDGNVLLLAGYENGSQDLLLWTAGEKVKPIENFLDFEKEDPGKCLEIQIEELKDKYNIVITPDNKEEGKYETLGDIMTEMEFVNTFRMVAEINPDVVKAKSGDSIHPENMRNNEGAHYTFNPHVFSVCYLKEHGEKRRDAFFNYVDALRVGEDGFKCPDIGSANWACGRLSYFFFPLGNIYAYAEYEGNGWAKIVYTIPKEEFLEKERDFEERICNILNDVLEEDYTDLEKALALYEFMTEYCVYDYEMLEHNHNQDEESERQSGYRCLMEKQGICGEIACLYQYLLLQCGVDVEETAGEPLNPDEDLHAWNYITLDGKGYLIDATWGLTSSNEPDLTYFLFTDEKRENRDGFKSESFSIGGHGLHESRKKYSFNADDERYSELWSGRYVAFDQNEKCIFYRNLNDTLCRFDYGETVLSD